MDSSEDEEEEEDEEKRNLLRSGSYSLESCWISTSAIDSTISPST